MMGNMVSGLLSVVLLLMGASAVAWVLIIFEQWHRSEDRRPGRALKILLSLAAAQTCLAAIASRISMAPLAELNFRVGEPILAVVFLGGALSSIPRLRHDRVNGVRLMLFALVAYASVQIVSAVANHQQTMTPKMLGLVFLPALAIMIVGSPLSREEALWLAFQISTWVTGLSLALAILLPQAVFVDNRRLQIGGLVHRLGGVTPHPELLAITAALSLLLAVALRPRFWRWAVVAASTSIVLAESRTTIIALAAAATVVYMFGGRRPGVRSLLTLPLVAAGLIYLSAHHRLWSDITESSEAGLTSGAATLNSRTIVWELANRYADTKPFIGWGPGAFDKNATGPFADVFFLNAHSQFYEALVETGLIGTGLILLFTVGMIASAVRNRREGIFPAVIAFTLITMTTEVPFTIHLYGANYVITVASLLLLVIVGASRQSPPSSSAACAADLTEVGHEMLAIRKPHRTVVHQPFRRQGRAGQTTEHTR